MNQMNHGPGMFRPSLSLQSFTDQTPHHTLNIRLATPRHVDTSTRGVIGPRVRVDYLKGSLPSQNVEQH